MFDGGRDALDGGADPRRRRAGERRRTPVHDAYGEASDGDRRRSRLPQVEVAHEPRRPEDGPRQRRAPRGRGEDREGVRLEGRQGRLVRRLRALLRLPRGQRGDRLLEVRRLPRGVGVGPAPAADERHPLEPRGGRGRQVFPRASREGRADAQGGSCHDRQGLRPLRARLGGHPEDRLPRHEGARGLLRAGHAVLPRREEGRRRDDALPRPPHRHGEGASRRRLVLDEARDRVAGASARGAAADRVRRDGVHDGVLHPLRAAHPTTRPTSRRAARPRPSSARTSATSSGSSGPSTTTGATPSTSAARTRTARPPTTRSRSSSSTWWRRRPSRRRSSS